MHRKHGRENNFDFVRPPQLRHGGVIGFDVFQPHWSGVPRDIVRASQNHSDPRPQIDHIPAEAHQHLRRGLPADATVDVGLAGEIILQLPHVSNGIAEEYDSVLIRRGWLESGVRGAIARKFAEVICENGDARSSVLIQAGMASRGQRYLLGVRREREENQSSPDYRLVSHAANANTTRLLQQRRSAQASASPRLTDGSALVASTALSLARAF